MLLNTPVEVYPTLWQPEKQDVKSRISPSCVYEMCPDTIFSKRNQVFQKERKNYYLQSSVICAMQAFNTSPDNSHAETDDLQLR